MKDELERTGKEVLTNNKITTPRLAQMDGQKAQYPVGIFNEAGKFRNKDFPNTSCEVCRYSNPKCQLMQFNINKTDNNAQT